MTPPHVTKQNPGRHTPHAFTLAVRALTGVRTFNVLDIQGEIRAGKLGGLPLDAERAAVQGMQHADARCEATAQGGAQACGEQRKKHGTAPAEVAGLGCGFAGGGVDVHRGPSDGRRTVRPGDPDRPQPKLPGRQTVGVITRSSVHTGSLNSYTQFCRAWDFNSEKNSSSLILMLFTTPLCFGPVTATSRSDAARRQARQNGGPRDPPPTRLSKQWGCKRRLLCGLTGARRRTRGRTPHAGLPCGGRSRSACDSGAGPQRVRLVVSYGRWCPAVGHPLDVGGRRPRASHPCRRLCFLQLLL